MSNEKDLSKKLAGLSGIASAVAPRDVTMVCFCGYQQTASGEQVAEYLAKGWPEHCDRMMGLVPSPDPAESYRQGLAMANAVLSNKK